MRNIVFGFASLVTVAAINVLPATAQYWEGRGSWCAPGGSVLDCSYYSLEQCRATTHGYGHCTPSPAR